MEKQGEFENCSRYISDTAFQKYVGKPAFANYGQGNNKPVVGGCNYGEFMFSHNINPHRLGNNPAHPQVYTNAEKEYVRQRSGQKPTFLGESSPNKDFEKTVSLRES